jgi:hypothetical protein
MEGQNHPTRSQLIRQRRHKKKRAQMTAVGAAVLIFAVVGVLSIIWLAGSSLISYTRGYFSPDDTTEFFEQYIGPIVAEDPAPFDDISQLDKNWMLKTAIWAALRGQENSGQYAYTSDNRQILPAADLTKVYKKYFGDSQKPEFKTLTDSGVTYEYNANEKCYYVPIVAVSNAYTPTVTNLSRDGNNVKLTVDYIPSSGWGQNPDGTVSMPEPAKTLIYVLVGSNGNYALQSVQNTAAYTSSAAGG